MPGRNNRGFTVCTEIILAKNNTLKLTLKFKECFIKKTRKQPKKQPFSGYRRSKLHFGEIKSMPSILNFFLH
jgi:hypothetical protein